MIQDGANGAIIGLILGIRFNEEISRVRHTIPTKFSIYSRLGTANTYRSREYGGASIPGRKFSTLAYYKIELHARFQHLVLRLIVPPIRLKMIQCTAYLRLYTIVL